ncbi:uncharacterized protein LOC129746287 [Uranotaenia lowii]|uniref:uncharacterized protein LOC129746287 n=1 Tax=Uranotaenia lowii TaxID=190385 RepID=UPI002479032F|nr:uncharacterized protein LOC129746287 [Uranotaenia lowii]
MVQDTNLICPRIYNACRLCKIRGNQLNKIDKNISAKIYECTTLQIISTPQCKAFICDGCKAKIDEHYQFKMQCIRNVNLQRFNGPIQAALAASAVAGGASSSSSGAPVTPAATAESNLAATTAVPLNTSPVMEGAASSGSTSKQ